jgi:3-oxoacyl-ACP reductase-like protein
MTDAAQSQQHGDDEDDGSAAGGKKKHHKKSKKRRHDADEEEEDGASAASAAAAPAAASASTASAASSGKKVKVETCEKPAYDFFAFGGHLDKSIDELKKAITSDALKEGLLMREGAFSIMDYELHVFAVRNLYD